MYPFQTKYASVISRYLDQIFGSGSPTIQKTDAAPFLQSDGQDTPPLAALVTENLSPEIIRKILTRLDAGSQTIFISNMERLIDQKKLHGKQFDEVFPMLAPGEKNICRLILEGKSVKEISLLLQKSISNITCRRTHIRSKLGLTRKDDLRQALRERIRETAIPKEFPETEKQSANL